MKSSGRADELCCCKNITDIHSSFLSKTSTETPAYFSCFSVVFSTSCFSYTWKLGAHKMGRRRHHCFHDMFDKELAVGATSLVHMQRPRDLSTMSINAICHTTSHTYSNAWITFIEPKLGIDFQCILPVGTVTLQTTGIPDTFASLSGEKPKDSERQQATHHFNW